MAVPVAPSAPSASRRKQIVRAAFAIGLTVAGYLAVKAGWSRPTSSAPGAPLCSFDRLPRSLPLDNYFRRSQPDDYFAEGMTDELTANLATISQLPSDFPAGR